MCQSAKFVQICPDSCIRMKSKFTLGGTKSLNVWRTKFSHSPYTATSYSLSSQDNESLGVWRAKFDESSTSEDYTDDISDRSRDWFAAGARARGVHQNPFIRRVGNWNRQHPRRIGGNITTSS